MELSIRTADVAAIACYLIAMVVAGVYFSRRMVSTEAYFVGNRSFSGWVIGLSMLGTIISSGTFLALPAAAYVLDWRQLTVNLVLPVVAAIAIFVFIPLFRNGNVTTAFEYLDARFGTIPRLYGTVSFVVLQIIRMAQILFLVSLPIQFLTGAPLIWIIVGCGIFIAFYTIAGGMEAVVWTDVVQAIILMCGGVLCFVTIVFALPDGVASIVSTGVEHDKFSLGSMEWNIGERTFWTVLILGVINWLAIYSGDQNMVQRYAAARSTYEARKATVIYSAIALPLWILFFFVGTSLFVYYQHFPDSAIANMQPDQVLPYFILTEIPAGLAGLVIAAVLAAAMSSLDSGINAISTVAVVDVMRPFAAKDRGDAYYLRAARVIGAVCTLLVVLGAIVFSMIEKESMNDVSLIVTSVFGGCLMGLFMVGFFVPRVDGTTATVAIGLAVLFNIYLGLSLAEILPGALRIELHSYWTGALVNGVFILLAITVAILRGPGKKDLAGLTFWTRHD